MKGMKIDGLIADCLLHWRNFISSNYGVVGYRFCRQSSNSNQSFNSFHSFSSFSFSAATLVFSLMKEQNGQEEWNGIQFERIEWNGISSRQRGGAHNPPYLQSNASRRNSIKFRLQLHLSFISSLFDWKIAVEEKLINYYNSNYMTIIYKYKFML